MGQEAPPRGPSFAAGLPALPFHYSIYGVSIASEVPLRYPEGLKVARPQIRLKLGSTDLIERLVAGRQSTKASDWYTQETLRDGSLCLRWKGLADYTVSHDGGEVACCASPSSDAESVNMYLLGQVLSFALLRKGVEPLHATAVVVDGHAIGFLGASGDGKSTLAAAFLERGHRLLTDDMLVIRDNSGRLTAYPGPSRIKLYPEIAQQILRSSSGKPMNHLTPKLVIPLPDHSLCREPMPLDVLYKLPGPRTRVQSIRIRKLSQQRALVELLRHTFNTSDVQPSRLKQQFAAAAQLAHRLPVKNLSHPRVLSALPAVVDMILRDMARTD